ncbi:MFS general substrate transporter [Trichodelitschia bisporula]|uniref:MFS general substrate transporter n=1 Tax=Trichodelitschia bisporula TaxID=703511 RepID=A0A6G1HSQ0_9PEZI|nr:MFS general substrate transporter [Trichodelitschia bisporula]
MDVLQCSVEKKPPIALRWRSHPLFILSTVAIGMFTDLFLYGLVVPILPSLLCERIHLPESQGQSAVSNLLAAYAAASMVCSVPAGCIADRTPQRRTPFLAGLAALMAATALFAFGRNMALFIVARVLQGLSGGVVWTVGLAMTLDTVGPHNIGKIFSVVSIGELIAPVIGGVVYEKAGRGVFGLGAAILAIDFAMRVLVIETSVARQLDEPLESPEPSLYGRGLQTGSLDEEPENETSPLLRGRQDELYLIPEVQNKLVRVFPIIYCFKNSRLVGAFFLSFVNMTLLSTFDATIPTEAKSLFAFSSLNSGLLVIPLDIPYLIIGPLAGWVVDKYGGSRMFPNRNQNVAFYCGIMAMNGVGFGLIGSCSIVESSLVVQRYDRVNPGMFGDIGPYAQLFGFNSVLVNLGLMVGPLLSGGLRDRTGHGNMNVVLAALSGTAAIISILFIGGSPGQWMKNR